MEESAYDALYTAAYIFVFIAALTVTLYLFNSIQEFSEIAYDFNRNKADGATSINLPVKGNRLLTGEEVLPYYYNYIKNDLYTTENNSKMVTYNLEIYGDGNVNLINVFNGKRLQEVADELIGDNKRYILSHESIELDPTNNLKKIVNIKITKATQEQIDFLL